MKEIDKLNFRPFTRFCMSIAAVPSSYLAGLTIDEQLLWLCSYLEKEVIPAVNNNGEAVTELQNLFTELHDYVEHYFDNLDVTEEINNKLDSLVEDGTLTELIGAYIQPRIDQQNQEISNFKNETINRLDIQNARITEQNSNINNFETQVNNTIDGLSQNVNTMQSQVTSLSSGSPIPVSSVDQMTATSRTYVNTTDGNWYYYNGSSWVIGGTYQSTGIANDSIIPEMTVMWQRNNLIPKFNWIQDSVYNVNTGDIVSFTGCRHEDYIDIHDTSTLALGMLNNPTLYNMRIYYYDESKTFLSAREVQGNLTLDNPENTYYCRFAIWPLNVSVMPDNMQIYKLEDFNKLVQPYQLKNYYKNNSQNIMVYNPYFEITSNYNNSITSIVGISDEKDKITLQINNSNASVGYGGFYLKANLKVNDKVKIITNYNVNNNLVLYPSTSLSVSTQLYKISNDTYEGTVTENLINGNNDMNYYLIAMAIAGNTTLTANFTVLINNKPLSLGESLEELKEEISPVKTLNVIALGDSITALTGTRSWLTYFHEIQPINIIQNVAVNGAWLMDKEGTIYDGNPVADGPDNNINNVLGNQVQKIINNNYDDPDIILIAIGTNGGIYCSESDIYNSYYDSNGNLIPLNLVDRKTSAGAFRYCNEKLRELYPNATIFWCSPIQAYNGTRNLNNIITYGKCLKNLTQFASVQFIDTEKCGITGYTENQGTEGLYLIDGLHPNSNGAKYMGYYNATKVLEYNKQCKLLNT